MQPLDPPGSPARSRGLPEGAGHGSALVFRGRGAVKGAAPNRERVMKEVMKEAAKGQRMGRDGSITVQRDLPFTATVVGSEVVPTAPCVAPSCPVCSLSGMGEHGRKR